MKLGDRVWTRRSGARCRGVAAGSPASVSPALAVGAPELSRFAIGFDRARPRAPARAVGRGASTPQQWSRGRDDARASRRPGRPGTALGAVAFSGWTGGALAALEFAGVRGRDGAVPVEHVHGHAAGDPGRRRAPGVRRLQPRRPVHVASRTSRPRPRRHRPRPASLVHIGGHIAFEVERIADLLPRRGHLPDRGLRARPRRRAGTAAGPARGATPASTRSTRPRRSRPARAACWSRADADAARVRARASATTASPTTRRRA